MVSTRTDAERLALVEQELRQGFEALADLGPAVCVFGSARHARPTTRSTRARARSAGRSARPGFAVITGGGPG